MNLFTPGDIVECKANGRRYGTVLCIFCGICINCNSKCFKICSADLDKKTKVLVEFPDSLYPTCSKKYRYEYDELALQSKSNTTVQSNSVSENIKALEQPIKQFNLTPKDVRPLGSASIDIPLITDSSEELEVEPVSGEIKQSHDKTNNRLPIGTSFDKYLQMFPKMSRPI